MNGLSFILGKTSRQTFEENGKGRAGSGHHGNDLIAPEWRPKGHGVSHSQSPRCKNFNKHTQATSGPVSILGGLGAVRWFGKKRLSPGYRLSPDHFQTIQRVLTPDWAQKNALYYFAQWANRGFYFLFVCSYTTAIISPYFHQGWACKGNLGFSHFAPTRNVGTTDDLGRRFRCYQQDLDHSVTSRVQRKSVLQPAIRASCS